jgi:hypothetical protein
MARQPSVVLTTAEWDTLLDGEPHTVDLLDPSFKVRFTGRAAGSPLPAFRAAIYREAEKRFGYATVNRTGVATFNIQAHGPLRKLASPAPPQAPAPQEPPPTTDIEDPESLAEALLGPCTCGNTPCTPDCARAGGAGG